MYLSANPVHREGYQPDPHVRLEPSDRLHEADRALLDQVWQGQTVAQIAPGDADDKPQMGEDQSAGGIHVTVITETNGQVTLFVWGQHGDLV